jgi:hypothetical protein
LRRRAQKARATDRYVFILGTWRAFSAIANTAIARSKPTLVQIRLHTHMAGATTSSKTALSAGDIEERRQRFAAVPIKRPRPISQG